MVTTSREAPFIFLTSSSSNVPTGRNARNHARAESARRSNPATHQAGSFGSFSLDLTKKHDHTPEVEEVQPKPAKRFKKDHSPVWEIFQTAPSPIRILSVDFTPGLAPNVNFESVLHVAAFHIRRRAAQMIYENPLRMIDALRCRQWCSVSATVASLGRSPYLDRAIACVVSKVQQVVTGVVMEQKMLLCYTEALHSLRAAVTNPVLHDRLDMLAATQLLAIYEMLDSTSNHSWVQHVTGAAAMAKLHVPQNMSKGSCQAAPMFVEALLNDDESFFSGSNWKALLHIIVTKRFPNPESTADTVSCFSTLRSIFADFKHHHVSTTINWSLLARAHELRCRLKSLVLQSESLFTQRLDYDILGLCLVSLIMLDRLIMTLRQSLPSQRGRSLEADTQELCTQILRLELEATEKDPGKDLLLAFQRQMNYPMLNYYNM